MNITTEHIKSLDKVELKYKKNKYPIPLDENLPKCFFLGLWCGARNSGKSFSVCQLLKLYEKYGIYDSQHKCLVAQRIILFSPTVLGNPQFKALKHLDENDIIENYSDSKLIAVIDDITSEKEDTIRYQRQLKLWHKLLKLKKLDELSNDEFVELELMGYEPPKECTYPNGVVNHVIFDDLLGSSCFKSTGKSEMTRFCLRNRHLNCNVLVCTQSIRSIPKALRTNTNLFVIFKFASKKIIVDDLYSEVSNQLTVENFERLLEFATQEEHDSLIIDFSQPKANRFKQNWNCLLRMG